jgi:hypothetical protein
MGYGKTDYGEAAADTSTIALFSGYRASKEVWFFTSCEHRMF